MNLAITRSEVIVLIGVGRTKTFAKQNSGDLKIKSTFAGRSWFDLVEVLTFVAAQHGYPQPQACDVEKHANWILAARLASQKKAAKAV